MGLHGMTYPHILRANVGVSMLIQQWNDYPTYSCRILASAATMLMICELELEVRISKFV
jgi:hypothetical protein